MIYLITGVPGSGKTLYAVSTLVQKLMAETIEAKDGSKINRRLVVDGIPDLVLPHDVMAERVEGSMPVGRVGAKAGDTDVEQVGHGLWNWWEWCKPGDILVVDEVQRYWRPRGMGTKPPMEIQMLETHRHFGVDLVIISQNAMLIDQNVRRLVGRHLNVRRIFGGARALIYDWDGCQADVHRTSGAARTVWSYPKNAYKLYKSSELHTKQHQKIPLWFAFPLVVLALAIFAGPKAYSALSTGMTGRGVVGATAPKGAASGAVAGASAAVPAASAAAVPASGAVVLADAAPVEETVEYSGCAVMRNVCKCYDGDGAAVDVEPAVCLKETGHGVHLAVSDQNIRALEAIEAPRPQVANRYDDSLIMSVRTERDRRVEAGTWQR